MPRGNGSGPNGFGPMTGRAAGFCAGHGMPGFANQGSGRGLGFGYCRGRGFGRGMGSGRGPGRGLGFFGPAEANPAAGFHPESPVSNPEREKAVLSARAEYLEKELAAIRERLEEKAEPRDK